MNADERRFPQMKYKMTKKEDKDQKEGCEFGEKGAEQKLAPS